MVIGRRGANGVIAAHYVDISEDHAPAQAPPLSTAAPVAMVTNSRRRRVATLVPVRLRLLYLAQKLPQRLPQQNYWGSN